MESQEPDAEHGARTPDNHGANDVDDPNTESQSGESDESSVELPGELASGQWTPRRGPIAIAVAWLVIIVFLLLVALAVWALIRG